MKDFRTIPQNDMSRVLQRIEALADDPRLVGSEKLSGQEDFECARGVSIIYEIADEELVIIVVKVGHRRDAYRGS